METFLCTIIKLDITSMSFCENLVTPNHAYKCASFYSIMDKANWFYNIQRSVEASGLF